MKRLVTMFTAILTVIVMTGIPTQAKESKTVWIDTKEVTLVDGTLEVTVSSNGTVTDGLLTLKYNPEVLTIKEDGVAAIEFVEMFSTNVVENEVRISFVAEDAIPEGGTFIIFFSTDCTDVEEAVKGLEKLTGEGYTVEGSFAETSVGILPEAPETPEAPEVPEAPETPDTDSKDDQKEDQKVNPKEDQDQTEEPTTGDSVNMILPLTFLAVGAVCVVSGCTMKKKGGDHREI